MQLDLKKDTPDMLGKERMQRLCNAITLSQVTGKREGKEKKKKQDCNKNERRTTTTPWQQQQHLP